MEEFKLSENDSIQLCDLLKVTGICSTGGHAKIVISDGLVKVDGEIETRKRAKINKGQTVEFDSQIIKVT